MTQDEIETAAKKLSSYYNIERTAAQPRLKYIIAVARALLAALPVVARARKLDAAIMSAHALTTAEDAGEVVNAMWIDLRNDLRAFDKAIEGLGS